MSRLPSLLQTPALRAFLLQVVSFFITLIVVATGELLFEKEVPLVVWALLQGVFAAALSRWARLAVWWVCIQLLFPVALLAMQEARLPPLVCLGIFLVFLLLFWTTFQTQVPFFPSSPTTWKAVARLLPKDHSIRFVDIGSGVGGLVLHLAISRPDSHFTGVELAPLPWLISHVRARVVRTQACFMRRDYLGLNFGDYDIVFAFLSPAAMPAVWTKARAEMRKGSLLLSYEFPVLGAASDIALPPDSRGAILYGWYM